MINDYKSSYQVFRQSTLAFVISKCVITVNSFSCKQDSYIILALIVLTIINISIERYVSANTNISFIYLGLINCSPPSGQRLTHAIYPVSAICVFLSNYTNFSILINTKKLNAIWQHLHVWRCVHFLWKRNTCNSGIIICHSYWALRAFIYQDLSCFTWLWKTER